MSTINFDEEIRIKYLKGPVGNDTRNYQKNLNIIYLNIQSLRNKLYEVESLIASFDCDIHIVVLTEIWLNKDENKFYNLPGYTGFFSNREYSYGGVAIFVSDCISASLVFEEEYRQSNFLVVNLSNHNFNIIACYRSHHTNLDDFNTKIEVITTAYKHSMIIGDFNINLLDEKNRDVSCYCDTLISNGYLICNKKTTEFATRIGIISKTIIDHFITDMLNLQYFFHIVDTHLSDHKMFIISVDLRPVKEDFNYRKTILNYDDLSNDNIWGSLDSYETFDEVVNVLSQLINKYTKVLPLKKVKNQKHEWMTEDIHKMMKIRDSFYKYSKKYPDNPRVKILYETYRAKVKQLIITAKANFCSKKISKDPGNPKNLWATYKSIILNKNTKTPSCQLKLLKYENTSFCTPQDIADAMNKFFVTITDNLNLPANNILYQSYNSPLNLGTHFNLTLTSSDEVNAVISSLKSSAATGYDGVSAKFIKKYSDRLAPILVKHINICFESYYFPNCLKKAIVTPIHKTGDSTDPLNYRPISILSSFSKIFERIIRDRLAFFISSNNILHPEQYGFEKTSSPTSACLALNDFVTKNVDSGKYTACLFIDMQKAFDCVDHEILLHKLSSLYFSNDQLNFFESYLTQRTQCVRIGNSLSSVAIIKKGVPQGSILGPDLFKLYIDDLARLNFRGAIGLFADDAVIKYSEDNEGELKTAILSDLVLIDEWLCKNKLLMNIKKTKILLFDNKLYYDPTFVHNNKIIEVVRSHNYLGLLVDARIRWVDHIDYIVRKISPYVFILRRLKMFLSQDTLYTIYTSYILSHVIYLNPIWSGAGKIHLKRLETLLKKSIKIIHNYPMLHPTNLLYSQRYLSLENICKRELYILAFKIVNNKIKHNFILRRHIDIHNHNTRNRCSFYLSLFRTNKQKYNSLYNCLKKFNELPNTIKSIDNLPFFKKKIGELLLVV